MSEAVAAGSAPSAPQGAPVSADQSAKAQAAQSKSNPQTQGKAQTQAPEKGSAPKADAPAVEDDLEEIRLGSVKARVPKDVAKRVKELERGFHNTAQELASERKLLSLAKEDPDKFFQATGIDPDQYAESRLAKRLAMLQMTPEQKKAAEQEEKLKEYEAREKEAKAKEEHEKLTREEQRADKELKDGMMKAWQSSGLPPDPRFGAWMASTMMQANSQGLDWTWEDCAAKVKEDFGLHTKDTLTKMEVQQLREFLGEDTLKKLREDDVKRVTGQSASKTPSASSKGPGGTSVSQKSKNAPKGPLSEAEYRQWFEDRVKSLS